MRTISAAVAHYLKSKPFIQGALSQGIINLTSLSRTIKPEIEDMMGKEVKNGALVMALKRVALVMDFSITQKILGVLRNVREITVRSSLTDYTFLVSDTLLSKQAELIRQIQSTPDIFYTSSRGVNETNIVISSVCKETVEALFKDERCIQKTENLSSITVKLPEENVGTPGIYYFIFQKLAWEGIVLYEVISTTNEFTILVDDDNVDKAFKAIKDLRFV